MKDKIIKEFKPGNENARNSEGAFIKLDDGRIAFVFSRYRGGFSDDDLCDIAISYSLDNGKSFSDAKVILTLEECNCANLMSISLLRMKDNSIGLFYLKKTKDKQCRMFLRKTRDFKTFSNEVQCIKDEGYFVVNNDRVVRLKNGDIIIPSAFTNVNGKSSGSNVATARFYVSKDDGEHFELLSEVLRPYPILATGLQEPGIIEFEDKLVAYFRNNSGRQYISYSLDDGETWTAPVPSRFVSPTSPMSAKQLKDGRVVIVYNPIPMYYGRSETVEGVWTGGRTPLLMSLCNTNLDDEYKTILLEDDPNSGFCYTAIYELEDAILLGYCAGGIEDGCTLNKLRIVRIPKEDLE